MLVVTHFPPDLAYAEYFFEHMQLYCAYQGYDLLAVRAPAPAWLGNSTKSGYFGKVLAIEEGLRLGASELVVYADADMFVADLEFRLEPWIARMVDGIDVMLPCQHPGNARGECAYADGATCNWTFCLACALCFESLSCRHCIPVS